ERQQRDKDEYHLTGVHVAEQTQSQAQRLGQQTEDLKEQVERNKRPMVERRECQFLGEAAHALDLEAVEQDQNKHTQRETEGAIRVGSRNDLEVRQAH